MKTRRSYFPLLTILFALFLVTTWQVGAQFARPQATIKVLAAPDIFESTSAEVELWHDYGAFALYRVSAEALADLPAEARSRVRTGDQLDQIALTQLPFNTQADDLSFLEPPAREQAEGYQLHLVQFVGPIKTQWLDDLRAVGVTPIHYVESNAYLVWTNGDGRRALQSEARAGDVLQFVTTWQTQFKLAPTLQARTQAPRVADPNELIPVTVQIVQHPEAKRTQKQIGQLSADDNPVWANIAGFSNIDLQVTLAELTELVTLPDVVWIGERLPRELHDEVQTQIMANVLNTAQTAPANPGYLNWLAERGFSQDPADYPLLSIVDDGLGDGSTAGGAGDVTLTEFGQGSASRVVFVENCTNQADGRGVGGHGHINASIAAGYDVRTGFPFRDANGYQRGLGVNPFARIGSLRIFSPTTYDVSACSNSDIGVLQAQADQGVIISSNSWGCGICASLYDTSSQAYDYSVHDADFATAGSQPIIMLFSAGNDGPTAETIGTPGNGKNVITVGASELPRPSDEDGLWTDGCGFASTAADNAMDMSSYSSRGPAVGGRAKPEITAPGTHIQGTASTTGDYNGGGVCDPYRPSGQTTFSASTGTSHSTPAVAGAATLYYHWLENQYGITPSAAMMKAYFVAHPMYLSGDLANDTLPSFGQGFGIPDMQVAFDDTARYLLDQDHTFDETGEQWTWNGGVVDPSKPVRIVLVWSDAIGVVGVSPQVNNLDLSLNLDGTQYHGNVFDGQWSASGGSADAVNNTEAIFLAPGSGNQIELTVTAANIGGDGVLNSGDTTDQNFAIICYNCTAAPDFAISAEPTSVTACIPDPAVYQLSLNRVNSFGEPITLSVPDGPVGVTEQFTPAVLNAETSSQLTIDYDSAALGSYQFSVVATSASIVHTQTLGVTFEGGVTAQPVLASPNQYAINQSMRPQFSWNDVGGHYYRLEIATDPNFTQIVQTTLVEGTTYVPSADLTPATIYYWRVTAVNSCGESVSTTTHRLMTADLSCSTAMSADVPHTLDASLAIQISSLLTATQSGPIHDVNVVDLQGTHTFVGDLTFQLESPSGTSATLFSQICSSENDFHLTLDDEAAASEFVCPPTDGGSYQPAQPLSIFDNEEAAGVWTLKVSDTDLEDNGQLNQWGLEICTLEPVAPPQFAMSVNPTEINLCSDATTTHSIDVGSFWDYTGQVSLQTAGLPATLSTNISPMALNSPGVAQLDVTSQASAVPGAYNLDLIGSSLTSTYTTTVPVHVRDTIMVAPTLQMPTEGEAVIPQQPMFVWGATADTTSYLLEIAHDAAFADVVVSKIVNDTRWNGQALTPGMTYYWRVTPRNACGLGTQNSSGSFSIAPLVTRSLSCGQTVPFEDGIPADWSTAETADLRWESTMSDTCDPFDPRLEHIGIDGHGACADADKQGAYTGGAFDVSLITNVFDISTMETVTLTTRAFYKDSSAVSSNDRFLIEAWDGTTWSPLLNWMDESHELEWVNLALDSTVQQVRYRYTGDNRSRFVVIDDVSLACVAGDSAESTLSHSDIRLHILPSTITTETMTLSNVGSAAFEWTLDEAVATREQQACTNYNDISWLSVSQTSGTLTPSDSADIDVTFDSTGLAEGRYSADLCVTTDEPGIGRYVVPVELNVSTQPVAFVASVTPVSQTTTVAPELHYTLVITNKGMAADTFTVTATSDWSVQFDTVTTGQIAAFDTTTISMTVTFPANVAQDVRTIPIVVRSGNDPSIEANLAVTARREQIFLYLPLLNR